MLLKIVTGCKISFCPWGHRNTLPDWHFYNWWLHVWIKEFFISWITIFSLKLLDNHFLVEGHLIPSLYHSRAVELPTSYIHSFVLVLFPDIRGVTSDAALSWLANVSSASKTTASVLAHNASVHRSRRHRQKKKKKAPCSRFNLRKHVEKSKTNNIGAQSFDYICVHAMFLMRLKMF